MRIAVISDIHGNDAALEAVLDDIARRSVDATVGLGDFLSGPFDPSAVADRLAAERITLVRGNHDRLLVEPPEKDWPVDAWVRSRLSPAQMDWLRGIPETQVFGGEVFLCHGTPSSDTDFWMDRPTDNHGIVSMSRDHIEARAAAADFPLLLCGHTHAARVLRLADGRLLVNPGTVGLPFLQGSPDARYALVEKRNGNWAAELYAIPYDRAAAAARARANGFPGFAMAVETGWATIHDL